MKKKKTTKRNASVDQSIDLNKVQKEADRFGDLVHSKLKLDHSSYDFPRIRHVDTYKDSFKDGSFITSDTQSFALYNLEKDLVLGLFRDGHATASLGDAVFILQDKIIKCATKLSWVSSETFLYDGLQNLIQKVHHYPDGNITVLFNLEGKPICSKNVKFYEENHWNNLYYFDNSNGTPRGVDSTGIHSEPPVPDHYPEIKYVHTLSDIINIKKNCLSEKGWHRIVGKYGETTIEIEVTGNIGEVENPIKTILKHNYNEQGNPVSIMRFEVKINSIYGFREIKNGGGRII